MSINAAMQSGVTALAANSVALGTISNNIANSSTTGFKRVLTNYTDLVSESQGGRNLMSSGGVQVVNQQTVTTKGELNSNTSGYSLGIAGQGLFAVSETGDPLTARSTLLFTRDGSFTTDVNGNLVNAGGFYLEGWPADVNGNIATSSTDISLLSPINVNALSNKVEATTNVDLTGNLNAATTASTAASTYNASTQPMSTFSEHPTGSTQADSTISMSISDSLGRQHTVTVSMVKLPTSTVAGETQWAYEISSPDINSGTTTLGSDTVQLHQLGSGKLTFDANGKLDTANSTGALFSGVAIGASGGGSPAWDTAAGAGAGAQTLSFGFAGAAPTSALTQINGDNSSTAQANGTEFGTLSKVEVGKDGIVTAIYSNGNTRTLAQVPVATFLNANGLTAVSGNAYKISTQSGAFTLRKPGEGGAGLLDPDTLEASTVDLAQEFTGLITTQRAYSAASKIITTADQMLQELLSIKQ